jgi:hypothetical protein
VAKFGKTHKISLFFYELFYDLTNKTTISFVWIYCCRWLHLITCKCQRMSKSTPVCPTCK